jgi:hypothetical protein
MTEDSATAGWMSITVVSCTVKGAPYRGRFGHGGPNQSGFARGALAVWALIGDRREEEFDTQAPFLCTNLMHQPYRRTAQIICWLAKRWRMEAIRQRGTSVLLVLDPEALGRASASLTRSRVVGVALAGYAAHQLTKGTYLGHRAVGGVLRSAGPIFYYA